MYHKTHKYKNTRIKLRKTNAGSIYQHETVAATAISYFITYTQTHMHKPTQIRLCKVSGRSTYQRVTVAATTRANPNPLSCHPVKLQIAARAQQHTAPRPTISTKSAKQWLNLIHYQNDQI
jgi:hypothetical protein